MQKTQSALRFLFFLFTRHVRVAMIRSYRGAIALAFVAAAACATAAMSTSTTASPASAQLHDAMRKLWSDHVFWTRLFIVDAAAGAPEMQNTTNRLLQNQTDIGMETTELAFLD